jgi:peroxiredoxin family protein
MEENPYLRSQIIEIVENQIKANDPPETKQTYERLVSEGYSAKEAKKLIACVVSSEIFDILKKQEPFNYGRFVKALDGLPTLPWD